MIPQNFRPVYYLTKQYESDILYLTFNLIVKCYQALTSDYRKAGDFLSLQNTLKALADPIRREILSLLKKGKMTAGEIADKFDVTMASVSRHLSVLKEADLIRDTRNGKYIIYEINTSVLEDVMLWLTDLKGDDNND